MPTPPVGHAASAGCRWPQGQQVAGERHSAHRHAGRDPRESRAPCSPIRGTCGRVIRVASKETSSLPTSTHSTQTARRSKSSRPGIGPAAWGTPRSSVDSRRYSSRSWRRYARAPERARRRSRRSGGAPAYRNGAHTGDRCKRAPRRSGGVRARSDVGRSGTVGRSTTVTTWPNRFRDSRRRFSSMSSQNPGPRFDPRWTARGPSVAMRVVRTIGHLRIRQRK